MTEARAETSIGVLKPAFHTTVLFCRMPIFPSFSGYYTLTPHGYSLHRCRHRSGGSRLGR